MPGTGLRPMRRLAEQIWAMRRLTERMGLKRSAFMLFGGLTCLAMGTCCPWPRAS